ncbi:MAG: AtpZ/AtpI family protein [Candidatus Cyclobacteriaceae bacterium M3_2C_046]
MEKTGNHNQKKVPSNHQNQKESNQIREYLKYSGLAFQMVAMILLALWAGMKIDQWMQWKFPLFTIVFILVAIVATLIVVIKNLPKS